MGYIPPELFYVVYALIRETIKVILSLFQAS